MSGPEDTTDAMHAEPQRLFDVDPAAGDLCQRAGATALSGDLEHVEPVTDTVAADDDPEAHAVPEYITALRKGLQPGRRINPYGMGIDYIASHGGRAAFMPKPSE